LHQKIIQQNCTDPGKRERYIPMNPGIQLTDNIPLLLVVPVSRHPPDRQGGFSTMEIVMAVTTVVLIFVLVIPSARELINKVRANNVEMEIAEMQREIEDFTVLHRRYPDSLAEVYGRFPTDPWGNEYQYLKINGGPPFAIGKARKNRSLVPVNSDYDLFSQGADKDSVPALTGASSRDDIIRANNGQYIGLASELVR